MAGFRNAFYAVALAATVSGSPVHAQATRTWVSNTGDEANPCSVTLPCKTFAGAIPKTAAGGQINCLNPGGYGAVTITKSITIDCTATLGGILASSSNGVIINGSGINVILRGLSFDGFKTGNGGIKFFQGDSLTVENSVIENFGGFGSGLLYQGGTAVRIHLINTTIIYNGASTSEQNEGAGIAIRPTGVGSANVMLDNVRLAGNAEAGLVIDTTGLTGSSTNVTAIRSTFNNNGMGISVTAPAGTPGATVTVKDSTVSGNLVDGLLATGPNARILVSNTVISANSTGIATVGGGAVGTFSNNELAGNGVNGAFTGSLSKN